MRKDYDKGNESRYIPEESVPYGYTLPPTTPADFDASPAFPASTMGGDFDSYMPTEPMDFRPAADQAKTEVADLLSVSGQQVKPVVGWLVGIKGPARGKDFRLYSARNYIGRGSQLEVSIDDMHISREPVVQVAYDPRSRSFLIAPCDNRSHCLSYLNDELLMGTSKLKANDRVMLGETTELLFIPLCGPEFDWKDCK